MLVIDIIKVTPPTKYALYYINFINVRYYSNFINVRYYSNYNISQLVNLLKKR